MILSPDKNNQDLLGTIVEYAYAEYGSALEMLAAAKRAKSPKLKIGYIRHALDEYRHAGLLFQVLSNQVQKGVGKFKREYKFSPQNVIHKGYVDKEGYLIEKFPLKKFVEFVYSNEYLAKESFDYLSKRISDAKSVETLKDIMEDELGHADDSEETLEAIQKDELVHHGMAKKFYEAKFPNARLQIAFKREKMKNKFRMFYYKNLRFLNKIFDPILNFIINCFGKIVNLISVPDKDKRNLMSSNSNSVF
jgi:rubrerythrin|tara:strand:- start:2816 stop:3562 length:747 start_codon:yes stop_codon:yes gene_type:complete